MNNEIFYNARLSALKNKCIGKLIDLKHGIFKVPIKFTVNGKERDDTVSFIITLGNKQTISRFSENLYEILDITHDFDKSYIFTVKPTNLISEGKKSIHTKKIQLYKDDFKFKEDIAGSTIASYIWVIPDKRAVNSYDFEISKNTAPYFSDKEMYLALSNEIQREKNLAQITVDNKKRYEYIWERKGLLFDTINRLYPKLSCYASVTLAIRDIMAKDISTIDYYLENENDLRIAVEKIDLSKIIEQNIKSIISSWAIYNYLDYDNGKLSYSRLKVIITAIIVDKSPKAVIRLRELAKIYKQETGNNMEMLRLNKISF